jgi:hypothetical protein
VADCYGTQAFLLSWTPAAGWQLKMFDQGPAATAFATFRMKNAEVTMTVICPNGQLSYASSGR